MWTKINSLLLPLYTRIQLARDDAGQAMVEYTLIVALISVVAIVLIKAVGVDVEKTWEKVKNEF